MIFYEVFARKINSSFYRLFKIEKKFFDEVSKSNVDSPMLCISDSLEFRI